MTTEILVGGTTVYLSEWLKKGVVSIKLIHRIAVTKKETFKYGIKADDGCCFCGDKDTIDHTLVDCSFTKKFTQEIIPLVQYNEHVSDLINYRGNFIRYQWQFL